MLFPFLIFGAVIYFGVRSVMEREQPEGGGDPNIVPIPIPPIVPKSEDKEPVDPSPPGWPKSGPTYVDCETFMSTLSKEELRSLLQKVSTMTDAQWADAKSKMTALGQGQMASCLDSTRTYMKTIKMGG